MKTYRIYVLPSHQTEERTSGVDYARVIQPMRYLNGYELGNIKFETTVYDIHSNEKDSWVRVAKEFDMVFLNYTVLDWHYAAMGSCVHGEGKKIIMDLDDAIWYVQPDNITYDTMKKMDAGYKLTCMLDDVDGVTTTNRYLRNVIADKSYKQHNRIKVMENQIDFTHYNKTFPAQEKDTITLMHFGATGHFDDLLDSGFVEGMSRILDIYPNVRFKTIGSFVSDLKYKWAERYENDFGDVDIYRWMENKFPVFMEEADIIVVPLRDTPYNRCKSDIKFLEASSAMKPGVYSDTRPYKDTITSGVTGYLARTADEWFNAIRKLVDSREERLQIGMNAYNYVKGNRQIQDNVRQYAEFFREVLTK